jgi:hypothetical protein
MAGLSPKTLRRVARLFREHDRPTVERLLVRQCGNNLPMLESLTAVELERFQFAVLKISRGKLRGLRRAIKLAKADWRDLLVAAGFANDLTAHLDWLPVPRNRSKPKTGQ